MEEEKRVWGLRERVFHAPLKRCRNITEKQAEELAVDRTENGLLLGEMEAKVFSKGKRGDL